MRNTRSRGPEKRNAEADTPLGVNPEWLNFTGYEQKLPANKMNSPAARVLAARAADRWAISAGVNTVGAVAEKQRQDDMSLIVRIDRARDEAVDEEPDWLLEAAMTLDVPGDGEHQTGSSAQAETAQQQCEQLIASNNLLREEIARLQAALAVERVPAGGLVHTSALWISLWWCLEVVVIAAGIRSQVVFRHRQS